MTTDPCVYCHQGTDPDTGYRATCPGCGRVYLGRIPLRLCVLCMRALLPPNDKKTGPEIDLRTGLPFRVISRISWRRTPQPNSPTTSSTNQYPFGQVTSDPSENFTSNSR